MKPYKLALLFLVFSLMSYKSIHKYYISSTRIEYVEEKKSIQIITRIFIDDLEAILKERYDETIELDRENNIRANFYIEKYVKTKFKIDINNKPVQLTFIGTESDTDIVKCYLEIENIKRVNTIKVSNTILFDLFPDQQNVIKLDFNKKKKSFILTPQKETFMLKFN